MRARLFHSRAVNVIHFSQDAAQAIGWMQLTTNADIDAFVAALTAMVPTGVQSGTDVFDGIVAGTNAIQSNGFEGARAVIDVSGDGHQNFDSFFCTSPGIDGTAVCAPVQAARNAAAALGITINGLGKV